MPASSSAKAMPVYSSRAQAALLKAVKQLFQLERSVESPEELANGIVLGHILHELDNGFDPSDLDTSPAAPGLANKRNLQTVYKGLFRFIRQQVPDLGCQAKKFDYHAIAENPDPHGLSQLLAVMVSAAAMGPHNQKYIPRLQEKLDRDTQGEIMRIITTMQKDISNAKGDDDLDDATINAVMEARDIDLFVEEQNAALRQELEVTKKNLSDYITRLEYLQQSHEDLQWEKERNDRELEVLRKTTQDGANSAESIKILEAQVHEQMEIIARNEEAIRQHVKIKAQLESEVKRLIQKSQQAEELQDQVTELKHKTEELEKKANIAERYKQKLESQQGLAREVQNLQYEKTELQRQLSAMVSEREKDARTRKAEVELSKMISQSEQHLWDERSQKTQLMRDLAVSEEELARLRAHTSHMENQIQDMQEQLDQASLKVGAAGAGGSNFNLEDELNDAATVGAPRTDVNLTLQLSRLEAENGFLRKSASSTGEAAMLRRELDQLKRLHARLQDNFNDTFERHAVAQDQIEALVENMTDEGTKAFIDLRAQHLQANFELEQSQKKERDLAAQAADQSREILAIRAQLHALQKDSSDAALEEIRAAEGLISDSLKVELDRLREDHEYVLGERDAMKSQLVEALLAKERFRKEIEENRELNVVSNDAEVTEAGKKANDKIDKLRLRLVESRQQLEKSEQDRIDVQRKLKAALDGEAYVAQKAASDQIIKNLQRENALIATAWYDLTSRLQSNHVVLQRRHDAPKSWLNKQRQMVNGQLVRRDSLYLY